MLKDIIEVRKKKLSLIKKTGFNPYPAKTQITHNVISLLSDFNSLSKSKKKVWLAGRILSLRDIGSLVFMDVYDGTGKIQIVLSKKNLKDFNFLKEVIDIGDFLEVGGQVFKTKKGEKSVEAFFAKIIVKSLKPLPSVWHGLKDTEDRFRKRYLDMIFNPEVKEIITLRSKIIRDLREKLWFEGFTEVETPILQPIPGGALARPFITHYNALNEDVYLRIAPELYLKRLLVGGFNKIFEIGRVFRNEGISKEHNPEFTMLELYWTYQDYEGLMKFTERLLKKFIPGPYQKITYSDLIKKYAGQDVKKIDPDKIDEIFKKKVRPKIKTPTFVIKHPKVISPLAKSSEEDSELADRFHLIVDGMEVVNAFSELNDPIDQRERMEEQENLYRAGNLEASRLDNEFLEALEYGMPPAAGLGLGVDRLIALLTKKPVKETIIFPTLKQKD